ncbi:MAG TPA: MFS transporter [Ilumatobacteraceae bacterium]|nr:MFS transporter [Ilumatobacteraceae bacterium]
MPHPRRLPDERGGLPTIVVLGVLTITAYGGWYYGFGVLLEPIRRDQGWSSAALGTVFGAAILVNGLGSAIGGRLLDRAGPRLTFLLAALIGAGGLAAAALQHNVISFGVCYAVGGGSIGALGFYHVTLAAAARATPRRATSAIARLTMIGAFSSLIFLPLTAWLIERTTWRVTLMIDAGAVGASFLLAAMVVPDHRRPTGVLARGREAFAQAWKVRSFRRLLLATMLSGAAADIMLAFQVPIMRSAGLSLTAAAAIAGLRGVSQLLGRVPLGLVLRRMTARRALAVAHLGAAASALLLLGSGALPVAICFGLVSGASMGASSPLQGIYTAELVETEHLGMLLGVQQAFYGVAGAVGPIVAGVLLTVTGSWLATLILTAVAFAAAFVTLTLRDTP